MEGDRRVDSAKTRACLDTKVARPHVIHESPRRGTTLNGNWGTERVGKQDSSTSLQKLDGFGFLGGLP